MHSIMFTWYKHFVYGLKTIGLQAINATWNRCVVMQYLDDVLVVA